MYLTKKYTRMTSRQVEIMSILSTRKQWTIGEIATKLGISSAAATKNVDRLQLRGMVARTQDLMDRRVINVNLTPAAMEIVRREKVLEQKV